VTTDRSALLLGEASIHPRHARATLTHFLTRLQNLVCQEKLRRNNRSQVQRLLFDHVRVVDALLHRVEHATVVEVHTCQLSVLVRFLQRDHSILRIVPTVVSEGLRNDQEGIGERLDTKLGSTFHLGHVRLQMGRASHLEGAGTGDHNFVVYYVPHCAQPVAHSLLDLLDDVVVRAADEHRARGRVAHVLHKGSPSVCS